MKSKSAVIAALTSIACANLPLQAKPSDAEMGARAEAVGYMAAFRCAVSAEMVNQATADGLVVKVVAERPQFKPAIVWAVTTTAGYAAVQAVIPHLNPYCESSSLDESKLDEMIYPYLIQ